MKKISRSALLPYSAATMYQLVNDVASYPDFLPWCGGAQVLEQSETMMRASVTIAKAGLSQTFVTC
jgi:ribosome-associated toxin RatA of RatAB toxin-antitoxin module